MYSEAQEIACFLHGISSVGHQYTVIAFLVQQLIDALGKFQPNGIIHVLTTNIDELLATYFC